METICLQARLLTFDVEVVSVREATAEEIEHGHVHQADGSCGSHDHGDDHDDCCGSGSSSSH